MRHSYREAIAGILVLLAVAAGAFSGGATSPSGHAPATGADIVGSGVAPRAAPAPAPGVSALVAAVGVGSSPQGTAFDSGKREIFVGNHGSNNVSVISDSTNKVVATVALGSSVGPEGVAYDPVRGEIFVAEATASAVAVINDTTNTVAATITNRSLGGPFGLAYDGARGEIFVASSVTGEVNVIDDTTNSVVANVNVGFGATPQGVAVDSGRGEVFASLDTSNSVAVINDTTDLIVASVAVGNYPFGLAYDGARGEVFVANQNCPNGTCGPGLVSVIDDSNNSVVATVPVGPGPHAVAYDPIAGSVFTGDSDASNVSVISDGNHSVVATLHVGDGPSAIAFDARNGYAYVASGVPGGQVSILQWNPPKTQAVTFVESGLTGQGWEVTLNGNASGFTTNSAITFLIGNGTFPYRLANVAGWHTTGYASTLIVAGVPLSVTVVWIQMTYTVTFKEAGLMGQSWAVTLNGNTSGRTNGTTISLPVGNGTFRYNVSNVPGWRASIYSGTVTIAGLGPLLSLVFTPMTYAVTFTEAGLPPGFLWSVTLGNRTNTTAAPGSNVFLEPNGSLAYAVATLGTFHPSPASGMATVSGGPAVQPVSFVSPSHFAVTISETGLPSGTMWGATLNGSAQTTTTNQIAFIQPNGSFDYTLQNVPGFRPTSPYSGSVTVNGAPAPVSIAFRVATFPVEFAETGLRTGTLWSVTIGTSTNATSAPGVNTIDVANGTYAFGVGALPGYASHPTDGIVTVSGSTLGELITFTAPYSATFTESGLGAGLTWGVTLGNRTVHSSSDSIEFTALVGTYVYNISPLAGWQASLYHGSFTIGSSNQTIALSWTQVEYGVTFTELGLSNGTSWAVTLGNSPASALAPSSIHFLAPNGTWRFSVAPIPGFRTNSTGSVGVSGAPADVAVPFAALTYAVSFNETGLPDGTAWSVTMNGASEGSTGPSISFLMANGSYAYRVQGLPGYTTPAWVGSVAVSGAAVAIRVPFSLVTYTLTFSETGLKAGTTWAVTLNGTLTRSSSHATITLAGLENGTYSYAVTPIANYTVASGWTGTVEIAGSSPTVAKAFVAFTWTVKFIAAGLPNGADWLVVLGSATENSTSSTIVFLAPNGTLTFLVGPPNGYSASPASGTVDVEGSGVSEAVLFSPTASSSGLAFGTWVLVGGAGTALAVIAAVVALVLMRRRGRPALERAGEGRTQRTEPEPPSSRDRAPAGSEGASGRAPGAAPPGEEAEESEIYGAGPRPPL